MRKVSGKFIASNGVAEKFNIGFIPDYIRIWTAVSGTRIDYEFVRIANECSGAVAAQGKYGWERAAAGDYSMPSSAATGIDIYNTLGSGVKIPAPDGITMTNPDGYVRVPDGAASATAATISDWSAAVNYSSSGQIRSASVVGTCVRPPTHNNRIFELITKTGLGTSEPTTWNVNAGETVTDGGSNVWLCREEILCTIGGRGFTFGATESVSNAVCFYVAEQHDQVEDKGDFAERTDPL